MQAWFDRTEPEERGPAGEVVLLGMIAAPIQLCTVVVVGVALLRRLQARRAGRLQRLLVVGVVVVQAMLQLTRRAVMRRLYGRWPMSRVSPHVERPGTYRTCAGARTYRNARSARLPAGTAMRGTTVKLGSGGVDHPGLQPAPAPR